MKFLLPYTKSRSSKESTMYSVQDILDVKNEKGASTSEVACKPDGVETTAATYVSTVEASETDGSQYVTFVHNSAELVDPNDDTSVRLPEHTTIERYASPVPDSYEPDIKRIKRPSQDLDDADLNFFKSLLPDIQLMTASQKRRFKMGIFGLIDKVLTEGDCST